MPQVHSACDFVVVGGGSAGCVLAARLAEGGSQVALLEAGGSGRDPIYDLPFLAAKLFSLKRNNWSYRSDPQKHLAGRRLDFPRGKMLGGSFIFNGAQYIRGHRTDFDTWRQLGNRGWSYEDVLPYFKKSEKHIAGDHAFHGVDGPLVVAKPPAVNPLSIAYLEACRQAGYPLNDDFNGAEQDGFGIYDFNVDNGRRMTTARAFLRPATRHRNLVVIVNANVTRVVLEAGATTGVEFERNGELHHVTARREVILSAGSFNSPKILMLSGIGDPAELQSVGVPVRHALKGVGKNLQDHVNIAVAHECKEPVSFAAHLRWHSLAFHMLRAIAVGKGPVSQSPLEAGGFFRTKDGGAGPDCQAVFIPYYPGQGLKIWAPWAGRLDGHSFVVHVWPNRPESRGRVYLRSADPREAPAFDPNFLSSERDLETTRDALRVTRTIFAQSALDRFRGKELAPGADVRSDDELDRYIRENAGIGHHACGTARMGPDDLAVVDDRLRVHGVGRLRVADASIMPNMVSGNTNAATIMIAEKAADMILRRDPGAAEVRVQPAIVHHP